jgi:hypothetical protein
MVSNIEFSKSDRKFKSLRTQRTLFAHKAFVRCIHTNLELKYRATNKHQYELFHKVT